MIKLHYFVKHVKALPYGRALSFSKLFKLRKVKLESNFKYCSITFTLIQANFELNLIWFIKLQSFFTASSFANLFYHFSSIPRGLLELLYERSFQSIKFQFTPTESFQKYILINLAEFLIQQSWFCTWRGFVLKICMNVCNQIGKFFGNH